MVRADGTRVRSGSFDRREQVGEWVTYDRTGAVYKVTVMKPKSPKAHVTGSPPNHAAPDRDAQSSEKDLRAGI